jgi:hypothetical protein
VAEGTNLRIRSRERGAVENGSELDLDRTGSGDRVIILSRPSIGHVVVERRCSGLKEPV